MDFIACRNIYISMIYSAVVRNSVLPLSSILQKRICFVSSLGWTDIWSPSIPITQVVIFHLLMIYPRQLNRTFPSFCLTYYIFAVVRWLFHNQAYGNS